MDSIVLFTAHDTYSIPRNGEQVCLDKEIYTVSNIVNYPKTGFVEVILTN